MEPPDGAKFEAVTLEDVGKGPAKEPHHKGEGGRSPRHSPWEAEPEDGADKRKVSCLMNNKRCFTGINWKIGSTYEPKIMLTGSQISCTLRLLMPLRTSRLTLFGMFDAWYSFQMRGPILLHGSDTWHR
eukprot:9495196-Pyramimonas_sp.AAC.1